MRTSFFKRYGNVPNGVAICRYPPSNWKGRWYPKLAPSPRLLCEWNGTGKIKTKEEFEKRYYEECLDKLDPRQVAEELGHDAVLLCYEPAGKFCHRQLVAKWLMLAFGDDIPELWCIDEFH